MEIIIITSSIEPPRWMYVTTGLNKGLDQATYCTRQNLKADYFDRRHFGETTLRATALDLTKTGHLDLLVKPTPVPCLFLTLVE